MKVSWCMKLHKPRKEELLQLHNSEREKLENIMFNEEMDALSKYIIYMLYVIEIYLSSITALYLFGLFSL